MSNKRAATRSKKNSKSRSKSKAKRVPRDTERSLPKPIFTTNPLLETIYIPDRAFAVKFSKDVDTSFGSQEGPFLFKSTSSVSYPTLPPNKSPKSVQELHFKLGQSMDYEGFGNVGSSRMRSPPEAVGRHQKNVTDPDAHRETRAIEDEALTSPAKDPRFVGMDFNAGITAMNEADASELISSKRMASKSVVPSSADMSPDAPSTPYAIVHMPNGTALFDMPKQQVDKLVRLFVLPVQDGSLWPQISPQSQTRSIPSSPNEMAITLATTDCESKCTARLELVDTSSLSNITERFSKLTTDKSAMAKIPSFPQSISSFAEPADSWLSHEAVRFNQLSIKSSVNSTLKAPLAITTRDSELLATPTTTEHSPTLLPKTISSLSSPDEGVLLGRQSCLAYLPNFNETDNPRARNEFIAPPDQSGNQKTTKRSESCSSPATGSLANMLSSISSVASEQRVANIEKQLEYEHLHTMLGVKSLNDFLDVLDADDEGNTSKRSICEAFVALAAEERQFIQCLSKDPTMSKLVFQNDDTRLAHVNLDVQLSIRLGYIGLYQFLQMVEFNEAGEASEDAVIDAFKMAANKEKVMKKTSKAATRRKKQAARQVFLARCANSD